MAFSKLELVPTSGHLQEYSDQPNLDESLDVSRSLLNAARFTSVELCESAELCESEEWHEDRPEPSVPERHHLRDHIVTKKDYGFVSDGRCEESFTREALSTLKYIQGLVNMELGRDVRIYYFTV